VTAAPAPADQPARVVSVGIALKLLSVMLFMVMSAAIKTLPENIPTGELVFFRSFFAIPVILVWLITTQNLANGLKTGDKLGHLRRSVVGTLAMALIFAALVALPLPEVTAITYAAPLLAVVLAIPMLGEKVGAIRIGLVLLGLVGVMVILWPRITVFSGNEGATTPMETLGAFLALGGAALMALAQILTRKLLRTETTPAVVFYFSAIAAALSLLTLPFGWSMPSGITLATLVFIGLCGGIAQVVLMFSFRRASTAVLAPFEYTSMLFAIAFGYMVFNEEPTRATLVGASLVGFAGLLVLWREWYIGQQRTEVRAPAAR